MYFDYKCKKHGIKELDLPMNHRKPKCSCGLVMTKVFSLGGMSGDLPTRRPAIGKTRQELWKNMEGEGLMSKGTLMADNRNTEEHRKIIMEKRYREA